MNTVSIPRALSAWALAWALWSAPAAAQQPAPAPAAPAPAPAPAAPTGAKPEAKPDPKPEAKPEPKPAPEPVPLVDTRVSGSVVVAVSQQESAAEAIVEETEKLGGWFQSRTPSALSLRIPVDRFDRLLATAESQGKVIDKSLSRQDASQEIADVRGRLEAREKVLDEYYKVLRSAGSESVVAVQFQITNAIAEIEALRGRIRMLEDQTAHARLDVSFQFRDRAAPARDGTSSFPWLNTLNVQDVISSLQTRKPSYKTRGASLDRPPDGFSAWRKKGSYRAASSDDVLFRLRSERHKPKGELAFWKEAVRQRMTAAGYRLVAETDLTAGGVAGATIELAAPLGSEDWTYLVAFFPAGNRIVIAEVAGEITRFDARREAILAALGRISP